MIALSLKDIGKAVLTVTVAWGIVHLLSLIHI